jgi:DNA-binding beta-propeller fold protein YncE
MPSARLVRRVSVPRVCGSAWRLRKVPDSLGRSLLSFLVGFLVTASPALAAPPPLGALTPAGCFENTGGSRCAAGNQTPALGNPVTVAVSPDGANVYVGSESSNAVAIFTRRAGGALTPTGCVVDSNVGQSTCATNTGGLFTPDSVVVSPDGKNVYVASLDSNTLDIFDRGPGGALTAAGCFEDTGGSLCAAGNQLAGMNSPTSVAVSPDGKNVYVGGVGNHDIQVFNRAASGALTPAGCIENTGGSVCGTGNQAAGLSDPTAVAVSPDGASVYVASGGSNTVAILNRGAGGALTAAGCIADTSASPSLCGAGNQTAGLQDPRSVAVSPDGTSVYVASQTSNAVVRFSRAPGGALTPAGCISDTSTAVCGAGNKTAGLGLPQSVIVSPDGANVYVTSNASNAIVNFTRGTGGALTPAGCIEDTGGSLCGAGNQTPGLTGAIPLAISPDGASVYVGGYDANALVSFTREVAPACLPVTSNVAAATPTTITLHCTDPDLNPLVLAITSPPAHGTLSAINETAGTVIYTPAAGYSGSDGFSYRASDGTLASNTAAVTLSVAAVRRPPAPTVTHFSQSHATWLRGSKLATISRKHKKPPVGTTFSLTLNEAAGVSFAFTQKVSGRKGRGGKCEPKTKKNRTERSCTLSIPHGALRLAAHAGGSKVAFDGRLSFSKKLVPGDYTVTVTATNSAGTRSKPQSLSFTIVV